MAYSPGGIDLVRQLRKDNFEKYRFLINMHLTFTDIDLTADQLDALWHIDGNASTPSLLRRLFRKNESTKQNSTIGGLGVILKKETIVSVFWHMIEHLEKEENINEVGIFRKAGNKSRQLGLIDALQTGEKIDFESGGNTIYQVHDVATALKRFLLELPQPLFTDAHYQVYVQVAEWFEKSGNLSMTERCALINRQLSVVRLLMLVLPDVVTEFLWRLLRCLQLIAKRQRENKMDEHNLATVFTPLFFFPRSIGEDELCNQTEPLINLLTIIIQRVDEIFKVPKEVIEDIRIYYRSQHDHRIELSRSCLIPVKKRVSLSLPQKKRYATEDERSNDTVVLAQTTVSFVDKERSATDSQAINTDTSLAKLYAHVQMMPEGSEKAKRLRQFQDHNRKRFVYQSMVRGKVAKRAMASIHQDLMNRLKRNKKGNDDESYYQPSKKRRLLPSVIELSENETLSSTSTNSSGEFQFSSSSAMFESTSSAMSDNIFMSRSSLVNSSQVPFSTSTLNRQFRDTHGGLPEPKLDLSAVVYTSPRQVDNQCQTPTITPLSPTPKFYRRPTPRRPRGKRVMISQAVDF